MIKTFFFFQHLINPMNQETQGVSVPRDDVVISYTNENSPQ